MIFASDAPTTVSQARVAGASVADGPRPWPSDHGGVVATLEFDQDAGAGVRFRQAIRYSGGSR